MSKEKIIFDDSKIMSFYEELMEKEKKEIMEQSKKLQEKDKI